PRDVDLADDICALTPKRGDSDIHLRVLDYVRQCSRQEIRDLRRGQPSDAQAAGVRIKDFAVLVDHDACFFRTAKLAGRNRQLRMVPDDDGQNVGRADWVYVFSRISGQTGKVLFGHGEDA